MAMLQVEGEGVSRDTIMILQLTSDRVCDLLKKKKYRGTRIGEKAREVLEEAIEIATEWAVDEWKDTRTPCTNEQHAQWICQLMWEAVCEEGDPFPFKFDAPVNSGPMSKQFLEAIGMSQTDVEQEVLRFRTKPCRHQTGTMSRTKDIRAHCDPGCPQGDPLTLRWPSAPEGVDHARSSGLICATVVARAMWSRIQPQLWPEQKDDEDAITTYTFADFQEGPPWVAKSLQEIWERAKESAQQGGQVDDSFASICRSPNFVRAFWANPLFRLTTDHYRAGWKYDERYVVLGGQELARQAFVAWDGVEPETLTQAINNLTFKDEDDQKIITFAFFSSPKLLQVDFTPGNGSKKSLADIQTFSADRWAYVASSYGVGGQWKVTGQVHYSLMAIVLHRENDDGADSVRTFRENGREELPAGASDIAWPFDLHEPVPAGRKVTVFYNSVSLSGKACHLAPSERFPALSMERDMEIKAQMLSIPEAKGGAAAEDELEVESDRHGAQPASADTQDDDKREAHPSGRSQTDPAPGRASSPRRNARRNQHPNAQFHAQSNAPLGAPTGPRAQRPPKRPREEASGSNAQPIPPDRRRLGDGPR